MVDILNSVSSVVAALAGVAVAIFSYVAYRDSRSHPRMRRATMLKDAPQPALASSRSGIQWRRWIPATPEDTKVIAARCALTVLLILSIGEWVLTLIFFLPYVLEIHRVPTYGWDYSLGYLCGYNVGLMGIMVLTRISGRLGFSGWTTCVIGVSFSQYLRLLCWHSIITISVVYLSRWCVLWPRFHTCSRGRSLIRR